MNCKVSSTHFIMLIKRNCFLGKKGGDNTDYGDANVYLLEYLEKEYNKNGKVTPFSIDSYVQNYWLKQYQGGASLSLL
jgi:hypothetical protein